MNSIQIVLCFPMLVNIAESISKFEYLLSIKWNLVRLDGPTRWSYTKISQWIRDGGCIRVQRLAWLDRVGEFLMNVLIWKWLSLYCIIYGIKDENIKFVLLVTILMCLLCLFNKLLQK